MNSKNEYKLLFIIKYTLPIFILLISILATIVLYFQNKSDFESIKRDVEEKFIYSKKQIIKTQIEDIYAHILLKQENTETNLKNSLLEKVNETHIIILNIYNQYKNTHTKQEIRNIINSVIKGMRFNDNRGYFFIYDKKANSIIHPLLPELENTSLLDYKDSKGKFVLKESLELLKNKDEAYQEWYWKKENDNSKDFKKIGFIKNIYELDWFIGTGEYVEDFTNTVKRNILKDLNLRKFTNKNNYLIIVDENEKYIKHKNSNILGKSVDDIIKKYNLEFNVQDIRIASKEGTFLTIDFPKPGFTTPNIKIIYSKTIPRWNWMISTGFYANDVESLINKEKDKLTKNYNNKLKNLYIISILITICLLLISLYISKIIEKRFKEYKENIKEHIKENQKQYELLSQKTKLAAMGEMIGNIAHQWRQPLSVITTSSSGLKLQKQMDLLTDEVLLSSLDSISNSAEYLSNTIEDFKDFFKPNKEKTIFVLGECIEKASKLLLTQLNTKKVTIIKNIHKISVEGYERELLQVLINLINNSLDAFPVVMENKHIFINIYKKEQNAIIEIKDNAGGINSDLLIRIFEPYFTTKHKAQGTGLGLYISQEIITRHMKGKIEVTNNNFTYNNSLYTGAEFKIILPLK